MPFLTGPMWNLIPKTTSWIPGPCPSYHSIPSIYHYNWQAVGTQHAVSGWIFISFSKISFIKILFIYFLVRGEGVGEKEKEKNIGVRENNQLAALHTHPNRNRICNPGMCPDQESSWWPFTLQDDAQPTGPRQSGPKQFFNEGFSDSFPTGPQSAGLRFFCGTFHFQCGITVTVHSSTPSPCLQHPLPHGSLLVLLSARAMNSHTLHVSYTQSVFNNKNNTI